MPYAPPKNCDNGTCRNVAEDGSRFCAACNKLHADNPQQPAGKKPWWSRWYHTAHWRRLRTLVLARDPICKACNRAPSTVADHIKPHRGVWALFCDMANLQGLCDSCHSEKTAREDSGFGNPAPAAPQQKPMVDESAKHYSTSSVGEDALDRALAEEF